MKKLFEHAADINGNKFQYPINSGEAMLFFTDNKFFIYAMYTKSDFSNPLLIEVSLDEYSKIRSYLKEKNTDVNELYCKSEEAIPAIIDIIKYKVIAEDLTIGQLLQLTDADNFSEGNKE